MIKKLKNIVSWTYVINDLNGGEIIRTFYEGESQKTSQEEFRVEKIIKNNKISYMSNEKTMIIHLIAD